MIKIKLIFLSLVVLAVAVYAGDGNFNFSGQLGFHKTQSAQTLGHGRFGLGLFAEGMGLHSIVENERICVPTGNEQYATCSSGSGWIPLGATYIGVNGYPFVSLGLSEYFDFAISIPIYGEMIGIDNIKNTGNGDCVVGGPECPTNIDAAGQGNLQILTKWRAPFDNSPVDISLILGGSLSTGRKDYHGLWIRDPAFLNINEESGSPIIQGASGYTNGGHILKGGIAATFDLNRLRAEIPLLLHANYMYRMTLGEFGSDYPKVQSLSVALELTPSQFISLLGEYYMDMPSAYPKNKYTNEEGYAGTSTFTFGTSLHFNKHIDLQLGLQMLLGDADKYINNLAIPMNGYTNNGAQKYGTYNAALIPQYLAYGGLTFKIFMIDPEPEEEEEETRNYDTDGDGVCDPWVARENRQREYARDCKGIDLCPYEEGPIENKGCPEEEVDEDVPVIRFDVSEETISSGQSVNLIWMVANADEVTIDQGVGSVDAEGRRRVRPTETTTYTLTATGPGGTKTKSVEITVESAAGPAIDFSASTESIQKGQPVTLTWMVNNATEVSIEGVGKVKTTGSRTVKPSNVGVTTFTLTATGPGGTKTAAVEVDVLGGPAPEISFMSSSESIQSGQTVTLTWQVTNATDIEIAGLGKVPAKGTKKLKPLETTIYTLTATGEGGTQTATVEVEIEAPPPAPVIEAKVNLQGVTFGSGNATLTPNAKKVLDGIAEQLLAYPNVKIEIQGHTDNQGNAKSNLELSERRAKAVVGYLAIKGVKMNRMSSVGFGQDSPIADNKTKEGRELNRRIEMIRVD